MLDQVISKLDAIEAQTAQRVSDETAAVKTYVQTLLDNVQANVNEKVGQLESKVAAIGPSPIKIARTVKADVNRRTLEGLRQFVKRDRAIEQELKLFVDEAEAAAYMREASALTSDGFNVGGRTGYDPVFAALRLGNPLRGVCRTVATDGSSYQFRVKTGDAGATFGYSIQNNGAATTVGTAIWQIQLKDLNCQFPIRTAALDDIDGLEATVVDDMLAEFAQAEARSMVQNNDQAGSTTTSTGGTNGLRGLDSYAGAAAAYTGGAITAPAFGSSGTATSDGMHTMATYDQITTNANTVAANNVSYKDIINFIYSLPQDYWTETARIVVNPIFLSGVRGLTDNNGRAVYVDGLARNDGIVGELAGFPVVINRYLDNPSQASAAAAGSVSRFPMYFADWAQFFTIIDRTAMTLRRYDQTVPGSITFFGERRLATSVRDPNAGVRYRSTGTAAA
jgi:HK97 family phage major capsid protein